MRSFPEGDLYNLPYTPFSSFPYVVGIRYNRGNLYFAPTEHLNQ